MNVRLSEGEIRIRVTSQEGNELLAGKTLKFVCKPLLKMSLELSPNPTWPISEWKVDVQDGASCRVIVPRKEFAEIDPRKKSGIVNECKSPDLRVVIDIDVKSHLGKFSAG